MKCLLFINATMVQFWSENTSCKQHRGPLEISKALGRVWDREFLPHGIQKAESGAEENSQLFKKWLHMVSNKSCKFKFG